MSLVEDIVRSSIYFKKVCHISTITYIGISNFKKVCHISTITYIGISNLNVCEYKEFAELTERTYK